MLVSGIWMLANRGELLLRREEAYDVLEILDSNTDDVDMREKVRRTVIENLVLEEADYLNDLVIDRTVSIGSAPYIHHEDVLAGLRRSGILMPAGREAILAKERGLDSVEKVEELYDIKARDVEQYLERYNQYLTLVNAGWGQEQETGNQTKTKTTKELRAAEEQRIDRRYGVADKWMGRVFWATIALGLAGFIGGVLERDGNIRIVSNPYSDSVAVQTYKAKQDEISRYNAATADIQRALDWANESGLPSGPRESLVELANIYNSKAELAHRQLEAYWTDPNMSPDLLGNANIERFRKYLDEGLIWGGLGVMALSVAGVFAAGGINDRVRRRALENLRA